MARWMTIQEFNRLVIEQAQTAFIERATAYYINNGSWQGVALHFRQSPRPPYLKQPRPSAGKTSLQPTFAFALADQDGIVVLPGGAFKMRERVPEEILDRGEPLQVNGEIVGKVIASGEPPELIPQEERYLQRTNRALFYAAGGAALISIALGIFLARGLTGPLRELTEAIRTLAEGDLGQQVNVPSQDEIRELALAFNKMSAELEHLITQRQQMTADIAHDLRTPLTVISGYVESIQDGTLEATPERLEAINNEVGYLRRLVEDLATLSLAEAGQLSLRMVWISPQTLLKNLENAYRHTAEKQGVKIVLLENGVLPEIQVDPDRMMQVLSNVVMNALRHTPAGGVVSIQAEIQSEQVVDSNKPRTDKYLLIMVTDTGEGIAPEVIPYIFDRFYRADQARHEGNGESGLGLAIAKSIVRMHRGELYVYSEGLGKGSKFTIRLPIIDKFEDRIPRGQHNH
jgi:signal transduction histidine kinase